jgi:hypothetical protein
MATDDAFTVRAREVALTIRNNVRRGQWTTDLAIAHWLRWPLSDVEDSLAFLAEAGVLETRDAIEGKVEVTKVRLSERGRLWAVSLLDAPTASPGILQMNQAAQRFTDPPELAASLARFRAEHPDPSKIGFIMMRFGTTTAHDAIVKAIRDTVEAAGGKALRADDKEYHSDMFDNVRTYMHGCGFGIAVFERLEMNDFNPNVALEVGYMMSMGKRVCLLKDKTLTSLHADLISKLYRSFDPQSPDKSIPSPLSKWLSDWGVLTAATANIPQASGAPVAPQTPTSRAGLTVLTPSSVASAPTSGLPAASLTPSPTLSVNERIQAALALDAQRRRDFASARTRTEQVINEVAGRLRDIAQGSEGVMTYKAEPGRQGFIEHRLTWERPRPRRTLVFYIDNNTTALHWGTAQDNGSLITHLHAPDFGPALLDDIIAGLADQEAWLRGDSSEALRRAFDASVGKREQILTQTDDENDDHE